MVPLNIRKEISVYVKLFDSAEKYKKFLLVFTFRFLNLEVLIISELNLAGL